MSAEECYCTDEGPCENHADILIQREGASVRTADELSVLFIEDAVSVGVELSPWGIDVLARANALLDGNQRHGVAWLPDDDDGQAMTDELDTLRYQVESGLAELGLSDFHDDGYVIVRITGGPLADDDEFFGGDR